MIPWFKKKQFSFSILHPQYDFFMFNSQRKYLILKKFRRKQIVTFYISRCNILFQSSTIVSQIVWKKLFEIISKRTIKNSSFRWFRDDPRFLINSPALWTLNITHPEDSLMLIVSRSSCNQYSTFILSKFGFSCVAHVIGMYHVKFVGVDLRFLRRKRCCRNVTTPLLMATVTTGNPGCSVHVVMIGATDTLYGGFWRRLISLCSASQKFSGFATLACLLLKRI